MRGAHGFDRRVPFSFACSPAKNPHMRFCRRLRGKWIDPYLYHDREYWTHSCSPYYYRSRRVDYRRHGQASERSSRAHERK